MVLTIRSYVHRTFTIRSYIELSRKKKKGELQRTHKALNLITTHLITTPHGDNFVNSKNALLTKI